MYLFLRRQIDVLISLLLPVSTACQINTIIQTRFWQASENPSCSSCAEPENIQLLINKHPNKELFFPLIVSGKIKEAQFISSDEKRLHVALRSWTLWITNQRTESCWHNTGTFYIWERSKMKQTEWNHIKEGKRTERRNIKERDEVTWKEEINPESHVVFVSHCWV